MLDGVAQIGEGAQNHGEGLAAIVRNQLAHIFEANHRRAFGFENPRNLKKQSPAQIVEAGALADDAKRLTRKTGAKNIVVGNRGGVDARDVGGGNESEIMRVGLARLLVDVASENAFHSERGGGAMKPPMPQNISTKRKPRARRARIGGADSGLIVRFPFGFFARRRQRRQARDDAVSV